MRTKIMCGFLAAAFICIGAQAKASSIVYTVDFTDVASTETVQGSITTDGTLGLLTASNITSWNLVGSGVIAFDFSGGSTAIFCGPCGLTASLTSLDFGTSGVTKFSGIGDPSSIDLALFLDPVFFTETDENGDPFTFRATNGDGGYNVGTAEIASTPLPAALPLFATGLGGLGLLGWRRKRKAQAVGTTVTS